MRRLLWPTLIAALGAGCAGTPPQPTLGDVTRAAQVPPPAALQVQRERAITAYRDFLAAAPEDSPQRANALRRLADLQQADINEREILSAEDQAVAEPSSGERTSVIALYEGLLRRYPSHDANAEIRYQLARA